MTSETSATRKPCKIITAQLQSEIVALCQQPDASITDIAKHYDIHANTLYKWMRKGKLQNQPLAITEQKLQPEFIAIPVPVRIDSLHQSIRIEIPSEQLKNALIIKIIYD